MKRAWNATGKGISANKSWCFICTAFKDQTTSMMPTSNHVHDVNLWVSTQSLSLSMTWNGVSASGFYFGWNHSKMERATHLSNQPQSKGTSQWNLLKDKITSLWGREEHATQSPPSIDFKPQTLKSSEEFIMLLIMKEAESQNVWEWLTKKDFCHQLNDCLVQEWCCIFMWNHWSMPNQRKAHSILLIRQCLVYFTWKMELW